MNDRIMTTQRGRPPLGRVYRSLWILVGITVVAAGALSSSLAAPPSPLTGLSFAISALIFIAALTLAARVTIALERARRQSHASETNPFRWQRSSNQPKTATRMKKNK